ncbi:MAG: DUF327 family protein [Treponema sp.]|nr:DUF327 family protein [Treponema sp.]MBR4631236.1 DUF327 family protein [Treponema sp.]MBR6912331.1 DUF327 family protein [Treponema sp.]MCR5123991.1 YaaR family protein [Treponema sp.]
MGVDSVGFQNQSLYFAAAQSASQQLAKQESKKTGKSVFSKVSFADTLKKSKEEAQLIADGLPPEIAGMDSEDAIVFLKDAADMASDNLKEKQTPETIENYRTKIGQFLKFMARNNFEVIEKRRFGRNRRGRALAPYYQIQVINQKMNNLTSDMLYNHSRNLNLLARIEEINGLIVDLIAA